MLQKACKLMYQYPEKAGSYFTLEPLENMITLHDKNVYRNASLCRQILGQTSHGWYFIIQNRILEAGLKPIFLALLQPLNSGFLIFWSLVSSGAVSVYEVVFSSIHLPVLVQSTFSNIYFLAQLVFPITYGCIFYYDF